MEGKKISFGFMKTKKAEKPISINNEDKRDYIECVEEQSIKVVGGEVAPTNEPLVIPMKPNTLMNADRFKEIALEVESALEEPIIKTESIDVNMTDPLAESETLDQMAVRELMQEAKKEVSDNPTISIPSITKNVQAEGEKESTLDDYEAVPIQEFGVAMLRGMGWTPGQSGVIERSSQPSAAQVANLVNILEKNPLLARGFGKVPNDRIKAKREWEKIAAFLNRMGGSSKTWKQWTKYWADKKHAVRRKVTRNQTCKHGENVELSEVENRIFAMIEKFHIKFKKTATHQLPESSEQNDQSMTVIGPTQRNSSPPKDPVIQLSSNTRSQTTTTDVSKPTPKGCMPIVLRRLLVKPRVVSQTNPSSPIRPPVRKSIRGRRRIMRTATISRRQTHFNQIANRFLRVEEQRLENDRRTTNVLETITRVVNRALERDAENNRMMSQALLSVGEGLKLLAEAVQIGNESE